MVTKSTQRTWGVIAILAVVALVGWGVYEALDDDTQTGTGVDDDDLFDDAFQDDDANESTVGVDITTRSEQE